MIQWLHISDLHMKAENDADQYNFCYALINDCIKKRIKADFVVATGDFHNFWDIGQYNTSLTFLRELIDALGLDIEKDLFIIPGNHDVEGGKRKETVQKFLSLAKADAARWLKLEDMLIIKKKHNGMEEKHRATVQEIVSLINSGAVGQFQLREFTDQDYDYAYTITKHPELLHEMLKEFEGYRTMACSLLQVYRENMDKQFNPVDVHVRCWNKKINILHLNTAILSDGERGHSEAVDINMVCSKQIKSQLNNGLPTIVIGHHSFHDLHPTIKKRLVQFFNQTNVWAYLAGDKHRTNYQGDEFLIDRKIGIAAWPNIVAGKMAAAVDDNYSEFGAVWYRWDGYSTATVTPLRWEPRDSGNGLTILIGDAERSFPMSNDVDSELYYELLAVLIKTRDKHPSFQLTKIDEELFPKACVNLDNCMAFGERSSTLENARPLSEFFQESWNSKTQNHLMLEGEGGIGKTIALLSLTTQINFLPRHVPAIYIPLHALKTKDTDDSIGQYLCTEVLHGNERQYGELNTVANKEWKSGPRLVLLLDGFNEVPLDARYAIARNIEEWSNKRGIQVITASRFDVRSFLSGLSGKFHTLRLKPLTHEQIKRHLEQANILPPSPDSALWSVIDYPLMLTLYTQTESLQKQISSVQLEWHKAKNAGTVLWNYLQQELWRYQRQVKDRQALIKCVLATECIAPYLAWEMVKSEQFLVPEEEFFMRIQSALDYLRLTDSKVWPVHVGRIIRQLGGMSSLPDADEFFVMLTQELNLFRMRENADGFAISLMHQRFRDCLAAIHLLNSVYTISEEEGLPDVWKHPVNFYVMNFVAELINSAEADWLWEVNRKLLPTDPVAIRVMLELQKRLKDYDFSQLDFSGMDLKEVPLYGYRKPNSSVLLLPKDEIYLDGTQISRKTFEPQGHSSFIMAVAITLDGSRCVSASGDSTLRVWNMMSGECLHILKGHENDVMAVAIVPDGSRCVSASRDGNLRIWDMMTGKCLYVLEGHEQDVVAVTITPDGSRCVSASWDGNIRIWSMKTGKCIRILKGNKYSMCENVLITPDGNHCISSSFNDPLRVWDMMTGKCLHVLEGHGNMDGVLAITSDGSRCVSGCMDNSLYVWDIMTGKYLHILKGHNHNIEAIAITLDGSRCVSASVDKTIRIWDMMTGECLHVLKGHKEEVLAVAIVPDGSRCISASNDCTIRIWDMMTGECLNVLKKREGSGEIIAITPDGNRCVSVSWNNNIYVWNINSGECLNTLEGCEEAVVAVAITPDGNYCVSGAYDNNLRIWDIITGRCLHILEGHDGGSEVVAITPDGNRCVSISLEGRLCIWDMMTGKQLHILEEHEGDVVAVSISLDGSRCVSGFKDGSLRIWDMITGKCLHILKGHKKDVRVVEITSDGRRCVSASSDGNLRIWDMITGKCLHILEGHKEGVEAVSITSDGRFCVSASWDSSLRIWDIMAGKCLHILHGHTKQVRDVLIALDGKCCVSASDDKNLRVWDMMTGKCLYILEGHTNGVTSMAITPDGSRCVSASFDDPIRVWDIMTGECLNTLKNDEDDDITTVAVTPDGKCCISASRDGIIRIWDMMTGECLKTLKQLPGLGLFGINLSSSIIIPHEYKEVLYQNGAIVF